MFAKLDTIKTVTFGPVLDSDGTPFTGAIAYTDAKIWKNGTDGALDGSATFTHKFEGFYALALTANDISAAGVAEITLNKAGYTAPAVKLDVLPGTTYDAIVTNAAGDENGLPILDADLRVKADLEAIDGLLTDGTPDVADRPRLFLRQIDVHCDVDFEGALNLVATGAAGNGIYATGITGMYLSGALESGVGLLATGGYSGMTLGGDNPLIDGSNNLIEVDVKEIKTTDADTAIEQAVANVMDDPVPESPTADSINERLATLSDEWDDDGRLDLILDATQTAAEAVDTLTKADGDGDLAAMPASVWAAADRTLTGSTLSLGPTASRSRTDGYYKCPQGGTVGFYRRILNWDGEDIQQADIASITYSIFALNADDPLERTEVDGHVDVALEASDVIFDEVQSDEWASDYNFKHIPDISTSGAFAEAGVEYLVEYTITPTSGQKIIERIRVTAN